MTDQTTVDNPILDVLGKDIKRKREPINRDKLETEQAQAFKTILNNDNRLQAENKEPGLEQQTRQDIEWAMTTALEDTITEGKFNKEFWGKALERCDIQTFEKTNSDEKARLLTIVRAYFSAQALKGNVPFAVEEYFDLLPNLLDKPDLYEALDQEKHFLTQLKRGSPKVDRWGLIEENTYLTERLKDYGIEWKSANSTYIQAFNIDFPKEAGAIIHLTQYVGLISNKMVNERDVDLGLFDNQGEIETEALITDIYTTHDGKVVCRLLKNGKQKEVVLGKKGDLIEPELIERPPQTTEEMQSKKLGENSYDLARLGFDYQSIRTEYDEALSRFKLRHRAHYDGIQKK